LISLRFDQLATATGGTLYNSDCAFRSFKGVSIDSRTIREGELFIAIKGPSNDGHRFVDKALAAGAAGIVVQYDYPDLESVRGDRAVVAVRDGHEAMIALAISYRKKLSATMAAITGSNGKTTTKEFAWCLIKALKANCYRSPGNLNNLFGLPLSLFAMPQKTEVALMELGISTPGEMKRLARIVDPSLVLITNVGPSHLVYLKTIEAVAQAKLELVLGAREDAPIIINADDPVLVTEVERLGRDYITFGIAAQADFKPDAIVPGQGGSTVTIEGNRFVLPLVGNHQVANLTAAYACCRTLGYSFESVDTAGIELTTAPWRGQIIERDGVTVLADCYNANPDSVKAGLKAFFAQVQRGRRIVILGDMLELGEEARRYHRKIGQLLARSRFDLGLFIGPLARETMEAAAASGVDPNQLLHFRSAAECAREIVGTFTDGDQVYLKGSRGTGLEAILKEWIGEGEN